MEENKVIKDYQEFYDELMEKEYIPDRIDYVWSDKNMDFMRDVLFSFYSTYAKSKDKTMLHALLKLYSDVIVSAHTYYPTDEGYF